MKFILLSFFLLLNINLMSEMLFYKDITNNDKNSEYLTLNYPEECKEIIEISKDSSYEFKDDSDIKSVKLIMLPIQILFFGFFEKSNIIFILKEIILRKALKLVQML